MNVLNLVPLFLLFFLHYRSAMTQTAMSLILKERTLDNLEVVHVSEIGEGEGNGVICQSSSDVHWFFNRRSYVDYPCDSNDCVCQSRDHTAKSILNFIQDNHLNCDNNGYYWCEDHSRTTIYVNVISYGFNFSNNTLLPNDGIMFQQDLTVGEELKCFTPELCCALNSHLTLQAENGLAPSGTGSWRYPNGSYVRLGLAGDSYGISRGQGHVTLRHQRPGSVDGIWSCEVPKVGGGIRTLNLGIYSPGGGRITILREVSFRLINFTSSSSVFSLTCITTGGPATNFFWNKNEYIVPSIRRGAITSQEFQNITDREEATYIHKIEIYTFIIAGNYEFKVRNNVNSASSYFNASGTGVIHGDHILSNNSIVGFDDISPGSALVCFTDNKQQCCGYYIRRGEWTSPSGHNTTAIFTVTRGYALLEIKRTTTAVQQDLHDGMWLCSLPDTDNNMKHWYIGLFSQGAGVVTLTQELDFNLLSRNPLVFSLTCITTGGPASSINWTKNGVSLVNGEDFMMTQIITDASSSTYQNKLVVSGNYCGLYEVTITNSRTISPVTTDRVLSVEAAPRDFTLSLSGSSDVVVSWTPANSVHNSSTYIIYYETNDVLQQVLVSVITGYYTITNLLFGATYNFSMAAPCPDIIDFVLGPREITIGIPDSPESLQATPYVTSIRLSWSPPSEFHGVITRYEISYKNPVSEEENLTVDNSTTGLLTGLKPGVRYTIKVRAYTGAGAGNYSNPITTFTRMLGTVGNVSVEEVLDATTVRLSWEPVIILEWEVSHYTIYYTAYSTRLEKSLDHIARLVPSTEQSEVFSLAHTEELVEHRFQITVSIQVEEEEFESEKSELHTFTFDATYFQLHITPVDNCISWEPSKVDIMEQVIWDAIVGAVSELCNCSFPSKFLRIGEFRCWSTPTQVTYRTAVVGTPSHNSSQLLGCIEGWVRSRKGVVHTGKITLQVLSSECPVEISSMSEEECGVEGGSGGGGRIPSTLSLISQDTGTIKCVQKCLLSYGRANACEN